MVPENYVQVLSDPPEPDEPPPPPPSLSTFSNTQNTYPNLDLFNTSNASRTSVHSNHSPPYDQHQYMNPGIFNNWQPQDSSTWSSSTQRNVRYKYIHVFITGGAE